MAWGILYKRNHLPDFIWNWLPALIWVVFFACLAVEVTVRSDLVWQQGADACGVEERLRVVDGHGVEQLADREELHAEVYAVYFSGGKLEHAAWSDRERDHVDDVKAVLDLIRWIGIGCGGVMLFLTLFLTEDRWWWLRRSGVVIAGLLVGTALLAVQWSVFSRVLHPLVFPAGNWDFVRGHHVIIDLYPQALLASYAAVIIGIFVLCGLLAWWIGRVTTVERYGLNWTWSRGQAWLLLPLALGIWPAWWLGGQMFAPWDPGYWSWYLLSGLMLLLIVVVLARRDLAWPMLSLLCIGSLWWVQMLSLSRQVDAAARCVADDGREMQSAIERFIEAEGYPPDALQRLVPDYLDDIPTPRGAQGDWYYRRGQSLKQPEARQGGGRRSIELDWRWNLGFHGPLRYMHEYSSRRGTWNTLPWYGLL